MLASPVYLADVSESRRGFTLIEMVVATFLIALLGLLLALSWKTFGIPAVQVQRGPGSPYRPTLPRHRSLKIWAGPCSRTKARQTV